MKHEDEQIQKVLDKIGNVGEKSANITKTIFSFLKRKGYLIFSITVFGFITFISSFGFHLKRKR